MTSRTMKAAILVEQNEPLEIVEGVKIPELDFGQVLVDVKAAGICGKQIDEIKGTEGEDPYIPHLMGHEGAGIVEEVGPEVTTVEPGDHVVIHWRPGQGIDSKPPRFELNGETISSGWCQTFNEFSVASENRLTPIPKDVNFTEAALLGCAVTTGLGIIFNDSNLSPGESLLVFGTGGIGLNVIQGARLVSASTITAVDINDEKLERAKQFGAHHTLRSDQENFTHKVLSIVEKEGYDVTVDTTGLSSLREIAYEFANDKGTTVLAGIPQQEETMTIDSFPLHFGKTLTGSHGGDTAPSEDIPRYLKLWLCRNPLSSRI